MRTTHEVAELVFDAIWKKFLVLNAKKEIPTEKDFEQIVDIIEEEIRVQQAINGGKPFAIVDK